MMAYFYAGLHPEMSCLSAYPIAALEYKWAVHTGVFAWFNRPFETIFLLLKGSPVGVLL